jgi:hypothetical protein
MKTLDRSTLLSLAGVMFIVLLSAKANLALTAILVIAILAYTLIKRRCGLGS